jgi:hypothetical protein
VSYVAIVYSYIRTPLRAFAIKRFHLAHLRPPPVSRLPSEWAVGNTITWLGSATNMSHIHKKPIGPLDRHALSGQVPPKMFFLLECVQKRFEKAIDGLATRFSLQAETVPYEESLYWVYEYHDLAMELIATMNHNVNLRNLIECDPKLHYMRQVYLFTWESIVMHCCFGASCLCFLCASFLLLEALVIFGLRRCRQKLQTWNLFVKSKHRRF